VNKSSEPNIASDSSLTEDKRRDDCEPDVSQISSKKKHKKLVDPTRYGDWEKNGRCIDF
tara:strand:- start:29781 stop:29957 length:177 start_codon:yes stop_codon:yes gene_type:complete